MYDTQTQDYRGVTTKEAAELRAAEEKAKAFMLAQGQAQTARPVTLEELNNEMMATAHAIRSMTNTIQDRLMQPRPEPDCNETCRQDGEIYRQAETLRTMHEAAKRLNQIIVFMGF
jgi:hypothetical protein